MCCESILNPNVSLQILFYSLIPNNFFIIATTKRQKRKQRGGNKKVRYTEGWVEFADKDVAQMVAENLNNQPVGKAAFISTKMCQTYRSLLPKLFLGGRKNSFFYSDIWNMKYLPGFKWQHLSEKKSECSINQHF